MMRAILLILLVPSLGSTADDTAIRKSIENGLRRLEVSARAYTTHRKCFSCHHQAIPVFALATASEKGFKIDSRILEEQFDYTLDTFVPILKEAALGKGVGGGNTMINYGLETLFRSGKPPQDVTVAMRQYLIVRQKPDGSWPGITPRPPSEGSRFTNAFFALKHLKPIGGEAQAAYQKGKEWLLSVAPETMEDQVFHLRALKVVDATRTKLEEARDSLLKVQNSDGSWSQLASMDGDAYATSTALTALREAAVPVDSPAIQKGIDYLLRTQDESTGAWIVKTRSRPIQTFFDNGDPGGKSQFITIAATGWSVLALLEMLDSP